MYHIASNCPIFEASHNKKFVEKLGKYSNITELHILCPIDEIIVLYEEISIFGIIVMYF